MAYNFEWDQGNSSKNLVKHGISNAETESVFNDPQRKIFFDTKHSQVEKRYI